MNLTRAKDVVTVLALGVTTVLALVTCWELGKYLYNQYKVYLQVPEHVREFVVEEISGN